MLFITPSNQLRKMTRTLILRGLERKWFDIVRLRLSICWFKEMTPIIVTTRKIIVFWKAWFNFLAWMSIHVSQDIMSAIMVHLLTCRNGSRLTFSCEFRVLFWQMLKTLEGKEPDSYVLRQRNRGSHGEEDMWPDYSVDDYTYRPDCWMISVCISLLKAMTELLNHLTGWAK